MYCRVDNLAYGVLEIREDISLARQHGRSKVGGLAVVFESTVLSFLLWLAENIVV